MDKWEETYFILLAINLLLKTDFPVCGPCLFESHWSPQKYDLHISLIGPLGCYAMEYVSLTLVMLNKLRGPVLIVSKSEYLIIVVHTNSNTEWQTLQIQIRSQLIWIYTVCKGRVYLGPVWQGFNINTSDENFQKYSSIMILSKGKQIFNIKLYTGSAGQAGRMTKHNIAMAYFVCWRYDHGFLQVLGIII